MEMFTYSYRNYDQYHEYHDEQFKPTAPYGKNVETDGSLNYQYFPMGNGTAQFTVKTSGEARIALTTDRLEAGPKYEIILDSLEHKGTVLTKNGILKAEIHKDEIDKTSKKLSSGESRSFWIFVDGRNISCGKSGDYFGFIEFADPEPFRVFFMGICTVQYHGFWQIRDVMTYGGLVPSPLQFYPVPNGLLKFDLYTFGSDVKIVLTDKPEESDSMYEIILGGAENTISTIKKTGTNLSKTLQTPDILKYLEWRSYWIKWDTTGFTVGREGETEPFIPLWVDDNPSPIYFFGIGIDPKASACWRFEAHPTMLRYPKSAAIKGIWVHASNGIVPYGAVVGGHEDTGEPSYVARIKDGDRTILGKLVPSRGVTFVSRDNTEYRSNKYQVLVHSPSDNWVATYGSNVPDGAIRGGGYDTGDILYIGRVLHNNTIINGWVHKAYGACYIAVDGKTFSYNRYEVLMY